MADFIKSQLFLTIQQWKESQNWKEKWNKYRDNYLNTISHFNYLSGYEKLNLTQVFKTSCKYQDPT